jgi:ParB-like chromosome segregation protein Spo0J
LRSPIEPVKRRAALVQKHVDEIAGSMRQQTPIVVRADGARFALVGGPHRLEAAGVLGEGTIPASVWMRASTERPADSSGG